MDGDRCTQPGCTGGIEDGYCNVCGAPDGAPPQTTPVAAPPVAAPPTAGRPTPTTVPTVRAGGPASAPPPSSAPPSPAPGPTTASARLASAALGSARTGGTTGRSRRFSSASARTRSARLGAGITTVPPAPVGDPKDAVMAVAEVPEHKRTCPVCGAPVGRSRNGVPGRAEGFCPKCGSPFSFSPKLAPGDLAGGQYEVVGCLAHGGLGWIYLARDKNVSDRYVVLKGLLNASDPDAYTAAVAERRFLAEVEHPLILEIYNFILEGGAGYIVMEYVGGQSLKQILKARMAAKGGVYDPIPLDQAIAYIVEILPAFSYLHGHGLIYCDFKPDNIIQQHDTVKLIDLGGVRRADDQTSAIYGTVGYQAPEVPEVGVSVASDIYTIGRTLAVLSFEFSGYQTDHVDSLPGPDEVPVFAAHDSYYRLLLKACAPDPDDRFQSADELREQLLGVLREVVAVQRAGAGAAAPGQTAASALFDAPLVADDSLGWRQLPALRVDPNDPMAGWLAGVSIADPARRIAALERAPERTVEVLIARGLAGLELGDPAVVASTVDELLALDPWEWRAVWIQGLEALARDDADAAVAAFNTVYGQVPGELAAKLALAVSCERAGQADVARQLYTVCVRTDANYTAPAAFGLARLATAAGDVRGAVTALDLVPATSRAFVVARRLRAALLAGSQQGLAALAAAIESIENVGVDPRDRQDLLARVLVLALDEVRANGADPDRAIGGVACDERSLRDGIERTYRELAALTTDRAERIALVDTANRMRRRTLT